MKGALIAGTVITIVLIGGIVALAWHGTIDGQAAISLLSALGGGGLVFAHSATSSTAAVAATVATTEAVTEAVKEQKS